MEEDEMELTKEELQKWISERIKKMEVISSDVLDKILLVMSLLEKREKYVANFMKLCESVTACEAIMKKQYSLLGWEYRDTDSDDDDGDNIKGCGNIPSSPCESFHSEFQVPSSPATSSPTPPSPKQQDSANLNRHGGKKSCLSLKRKLEVVLTRLPKSELAAFLRAPQNQHSDHESLIDLDSDVRLEPEEDSDDSDYCLSSFTSIANKRRKMELERYDSTDSDFSISSRSNKSRKIELEREDYSTDSDFSISSRSNKRRKIELEREDYSTDSDFSISSRANKSRKIHKNIKTANSNAAKTSTLQVSVNTDTKSNHTKKSTPGTIINTNAKSNDMKKSTLQVSINTNAKSNAMETSELQASTNTDTQSNATKTSTPQASSNTDTKSNTMKKSTFQSSSNTDTKNNAMKTLELQASTNTNTKSSAPKTSTLQASANTDAKSNTAKTSMPPDSRSNTGGTATSQGNRNTSTQSNTSTPKPPNTNGALPVCIISTLCQSSDTTTKVPPKVPQEKITLGMTVLARKRAMSWKWGKIMEIVKREDDRLKYKINFHEEGKSLVSGHHIAFHWVPKVDQLYVGARVVVKCQGEEPVFSPGVMAELPNRKNRMRFLVFLDDHTPMYVGLPLLRQVCRPLTDPLEDIPDSKHKSFMKDYMKAWPNPLQTQYQVGRIINVELNGVQKKCEVLQVDSSLVEVVFQEDKHKEWIYRGSMRLEHMITINDLMKLKKD